MYRYIYTIKQIVKLIEYFCTFNPFALRKAKIVYNFGVSECNRVNEESLCN